MGCSSADVHSSDISVGMLTIEHIQCSCCTVECAFCRYGVPFMVRVLCINNIHTMIQCDIRIIPSVLT